MDLSQKGQYRFKVARQHYSLMKNSLAKQYNKEGKKLNCYTDKGLWMLIDNSYNLHELETVHSKTGVKDNEIVQDFFNSLKKNPITTKFILEGFESINKQQEKGTEQLNTLISTVGEYGEHIKSHTGSMQGLDKGMGILSRGMNKLIGIKGKNLKLERENIKLKKQKSQTKLKDYF